MIDKGKSLRHQYSAHITEVQIKKIYNYLIITMTKDNKDEPTMDFDEILQHAGHKGRFQKIQILLLMLGPLCGGVAVTSFIFTGKIK